MSTFKWLILNHSFWLLATDTYFSLFKPIFFPPAIAGLPLGLLRDGSFHKTTAATLVRVLLMANSCLGLIATILSRYLLAFPSKFTKIFSIKFFIIVTVVVNLFIYGCFVVVFRLLFTTPEATMRQWATDYDPFFGTLESSLFFVPLKPIETVCLIIMIMFMILIIGAIIVTIIFVYLVRSIKTKTVAKLGRPLILSCIVQIWLGVIFGITPIFIFNVSIYYQIHIFHEIMFSLVCSVLSYSSLEFVSTLYFVPPYRRYVGRLLSRLPHSLAPKQPANNVNNSSSPFHK